MHKYNNLLIFSIPRIICRFSDWRKLKVNWVNFLNCFQSAFLCDRFPVNLPEGRGHPLNAALFGRSLLVLKNLTACKCCQNLFRYSKSVIFTVVCIVNNNYISMYVYYMQYLPNCRST